ncbi:MAG: glycosyltransferase family 61 protein [Jatrophihabitans sp.]|uniref:glycosyltransferase family 61 protein n=1 Tax=Jatrophihabitans sp. TaxID=1932789 RepID=UPI003F809964
MAGWKQSLRRRLTRRPAAAPASAAVPDVARYVEWAQSLDKPVTDVVVVADQHGVRTANALADALPTATVHLLATRPHDARTMASPGPRVRYTVCADQQARSDHLVRVPQPQLIVDVGRKRADLLRRFRATLEFLAAGGAYVLEDLSITDDGQQHWPEFEAVAVRGPAPEGWPAELVAACETVEVEGRSVGVLKALDHRVNLRDATATAVLTARYGSAWGEVVTTRPAVRFTPAVTPVEYGSRGEWFGQVQHSAATLDAIDVPELSLRRYEQPTCWFEQRIARDNYWLPDTYRHAYDNVLRHRRLVRISPWHARLPDHSPRRPTRHLDGHFFYFDTEYPGHFGHVLTEVIARHWGWREARARDPQIRPLLSRIGDDGIPAFQRELFAALDVPLDEVAFLRPGEAVTVEAVSAASPMFSMPAYSSPELRATWDQVRDRLHRPGRDSARRLFVGRRVRRIRSCLNTEAVEAFVQQRGFEIFYPEDHDFAEQLTAFCDAEVIAGFAGSNMFTAMFAGAKRLVAITADTYSANNEYLIAAVTGGQLHHVIGDSLIKHPPGGWTWGAYQSNFTVDLDLLAAALDAAVAADAPAG